MKRILIGGYYGFDNAGDEAVLAGLIAGFGSQSSSDDIKIEVLSIAPQRTTALHGITAYHRYKDFLRPIAECSLFLSGGGSLLQDVTSAHGIFYYLAVIRIAQILGRKTMFVAQGIGPLIRSSSRRLTASVANRLDAITVRDEDSAGLLRTIGVRRSITVTADPALLLTPPARFVWEGIRLSMRPWHTQSSPYLDTIARAIIQSELESTIRPLNMYGSGDRDAANTVLTKIGIQPDSHEPGESQLNYKELLRLAASAEMLIGMRLHALIFAAASSVPSVALSYDPKVAAFMKQTGQADATFDITRGTSGELQSMLERVWSERAVRRDHLTASIPTLRARAMLNCSEALALLS